MHVCCVVVLWQVREAWKEWSRNTFMYQVTALAPFELAAAFESGLHHPARQFAADADVSAVFLGGPFRERFDALRAAFDARFERTFGLKRRGYSSEEVRAAFPRQPILSGIAGSCMWPSLRTLSIYEL